VAGAKARAIRLFGGRTASRFAGTLGRMGPGLFGGCSWASAQYEAPVHSLLCRWADCNEYPFRGQERLTLASAGDRACANRAFGLGSTRHSTRNCGPSGPGFGLPVQAGFGRSARRLSETVLEADSSSGPSEAVHSGTTPPSRWIGSSSRPPQRQQLACESHAEGAVPRNCPAWKARAVSPETSVVRTRLPLGASRSSRCGIRVAPNRSHKCPPCGGLRVPATERAVVINCRILGPVAKVAPHVASDNLSSLQAFGPRAG